jgi:Cu-Zn family superoxide dismutase
MHRFALALALLAVGGPLPPAAAQDAAPEATPAFAIVEVALRDAAGTEVGTATLTELTDGGVGFVVAVAGLEPGEHGMRVDETGVCGSEREGVRPAGGVVEAHAGDLGNLAVGADGAAELSIATDRLTLAEGAPASLADADGSALVIRAARDDLASQPAGEGGAWIACGVIFPPHGGATPGTATPTA